MDRFFWIGFLGFALAIVFALLGYLRLTGKVHTLRTVTGARRDSCGGTLSGLLLN